MKAEVKTFEQVQRWDYKTGRTVHLVDIENLVGTGNVTYEQALKVRHEYMAASGFKPGDHAIIACGSTGAGEAFFAWNGVGQQIKRSGKDGADIALIEHFHAANLCDRFDRIVIGSGDNRFVSVCTKARNAGLKVTVVASTPAAVYSLIHCTVSDIRYLTPTLVLPEPEPEFEFAQGA